MDKHMVDDLPVVRLVFFNSGGQYKTSNSDNLKTSFVFEESSAQKSVKQANS